MPIIRAFAPIVDHTRHDSLHLLFIFSSQRRVSDDNSHLSSKQIHQIRLAKLFSLFIFSSPFDEKGLRPEGVYVRQGSSSVPATDDAIRASSSISIYDDRIEFLSVGGLAPDIEQEDLMIGLSVCRNQNLANVFYRLQLIEAYGTGIRKIMDAYKRCATRPQIISTKNAFKIILPNMNTQQAPVTEAPSADTAQDALETRVLSYLATHDTITRAQAEALLDVSPSTASRILKSLVVSQLIVQFGKGRATAYRRK